MDYVTIKVREPTRVMLRLIAAYTGEQMVEVLERLCEAEVSRISEEVHRSGKMFIFTSHTRKGKTYVIDRFPSPIEYIGENGPADDPGDSSDNNTGDGNAMAGDDAV